MRPSPSIRVSALVAALVLSSTAGADHPVPHGIADTRHHHIESETLDRGFGLYVYLPEGYEDNAQQSYPTLYLLDGGLLYPLLAGYYRYLRIGDEVPPMIIVGISYPGIGFANGNLRSTDFTAPSDERDYYGGALPFQAFLREELFPLIESRYRSRADRRIVLGHSLGGQFALHAAQTEPTLFWGHIASNPALHRNLDYFLATVPGASTDASTDARVFVISGTLDAARFRKPARAWIDHWSAAEDKPWTLEARYAEGHTHLSLPPVAFRQGVAWLFSDGAGDTSTD